jgi:hypothetical protein
MVASSRKKSSHVALATACVGRKHKKKIDTALKKMRGMTRSL